jgi:hypothetical protein
MTRVHGPDSGVDSLRLNGQRLSANLAAAVIGEPTLRRTIEGASTLEVTVSDPNGRLRREQFVQESTRLIADDLRFTLVAVSKSGDDLTLTAEDEIVYRLRRKTGPRKAFRDKVTRAEFVKSLVRDAVGKDVKFYSPEWTVVQPIGKKAERRAEREADQSAPGISRDATGLTVKGAPATIQQKRVADEVIRLAMRYKPPRRALVALLCAATHESVMGTRGMTTAVDYDSIGLLQGRQMYNRREDLEDFGYNVRRFFFRPWTGISDGAVDQAKAGNSIGEICQSIQGNATGDVYTQWADEADRWIRAYFGGDGDFGGGSTTVTERYAFEVKKNEDFWTAIKRLADEVNWRAFVVDRTFYFVAEPTLLSGRRQMNIGDDTAGVDRVDWEIDAGKRSNSATVTGRIRNWSANPGTVVVLDDSHGPASGRWIVAEIDGRLTSEDVTITLKRPSKPKPEPKPETREVSRPNNDSGSGGSATGLDQIKFVSFDSGAPYWGGSRAFFQQLLKPFVEENFGYGITSEKRSYNTGSGVSDHFVGSSNAYAVDWGTGNGESCARRIAQLLGASYTPESWNVSTISAGGRRWTVQILWAAPDGTHNDHIHVGIRRA